jgi:two-component system, sensor histidine kinase
MVDTRANALTILVVEDERVLALDLQRTLSQFGYDVPITVSSGEEAIRVVATFQPDLVLMDLRIKGLFDGIETANRLRMLHEFALIYVSGAVDAEQQRRAEGSAPDAWLQKPYTRVQLKAVVAAALANRKLTRDV